MADVVYRSKDTTKPVYHLHRDCSYLQNKGGQVNGISRENIKDSWRCCDECKYAGIPTLD